MTEANQRVADTQRDFLIMEVSLKEAQQMKEKVMKDAKVKRRRDTFYYW